MKKNYIAPNTDTMVYGSELMQLSIQTGSNNTFNDASEIE